MFARLRSLCAPAKPVSSPNMLEGLESRVLMSAVTQPNFANFASLTGLRGNGYGDSAMNDTKRTLLLTDDGNFESRSVFWTQKVPVDTFSTSFSFVSTDNSETADGFTFTIQNYGTNAHGHSGANLGYAAPSLAKSVAVAFNLYNGSAYGSNFGFASGGTIPATNTAMDPVDLHNGDVYNASVTYDGRKLSVKVTDASNSKLSFSTSETVNIPKLIGSTSAFVGFTGSTGVQISTQKITKWSYLGNNTPSIVKHAAASKTTGTLSTPITLSVRGAGAGGESTLKYSWTVVTEPTGAKAPKFAANNTNASKVTGVKFFRAGRYVLQCKVTDIYGFTVQSNSVVIKLT